jgi:hypothetical protein
MKQNLPNRKQLDLSKTKAQLFNQVPDAAHEFISLLVDYYQLQVPRCELIRVPF